MMTETRAPSLVSLGMANGKQLSGCQCVLIQGHYAYVHSWSSTVPADHSVEGTVSIYDLDPANPVLVGSVTSLLLRASPHRMGMWGNYLVTCGSTDGTWNDSGIVIIDVSNLKLPVIVGHIFDAVKLSDNHGVIVDPRGIAWCLCSDGSSLTGVDLTRPNDPWIRTYFPETRLFSVIGGQLIGTTLYCCCDGGGSDRFTIVDLSVINSPVIVGSVQDHTILADCHDVRVRNGLAYVVSRVSNSFAVIDLADLKKPVIVKSLIDNVYLNGAHSIELMGDYAVIPTVFGDYLTVVDISDPMTPFVANYFTRDSFDYPNHIEIVDGKAVVAVQLSGSLHQIRISMVKPINEVTRLLEYAKSYCHYLRRTPDGWMCGLIQRATGVDPCLPDDWAGCGLNGGGKPLTDIAEILK